MDAKFTKGPWVSRPSPVDPKPWRCVYFSTKPDEPYCTSALEPADAKLIAAAPDLYEALRQSQQCLAMLVDPANYATSTMHAYAQIKLVESKARAALAKAV